MNRPHQSDPGLLDIIEAGLQLVDRLFSEHQIWYCVSYGTLLGGMRSEDFISWDDDFDCFIRPEQVDKILALNDLVGPDYRFAKQARGPHYLAINPGGVGPTFESCIVEMYHKGTQIADLYYFTLFADGVLRRYDPVQQVYWCPRLAFPHYFVEQLDEIRLRGQWYPTVRDPEMFLEGVYGRDWQTPYRAVKHGGVQLPERTIFGDRYIPKLREELCWCKERGWDQSQYGDRPPWPAPIRGAGPIGPTSRTINNSRSLWWRDLSELVQFY